MLGLISTLTRSAGYVTFNPAFQDLEAEKIKKEYETYVAVSLLHPDT